MDLKKSIIQYYSYQICPYGIYNKTIVKIYVTLPYFTFRQVRGMHAATYCDVLRVSYMYNKHTTHTHFSSTPS